MSSSVAASRLDEFRVALGGSVNDELMQDDDLARYAVDGMTPDLVVAPAHEAEAASVMAAARDFGLAVVPFGSGAHISFGNVPSAYDIALSTAKLDRVVAHEPADLTVSVEPGVRLGDLQTRLAAHNQFLPLDPPCGDEATIGGLIACASFGPMRHAFGTVRDWLIGIRVVHADGRISKAGGRVVKNVAGYEMTKLYAGSLGSLGVISEATFKLTPAPATQQTAIVRFHSPHAAATFAFAAADAGLSLQAAELLSPPGSFAVVADAAWTVLLRAAGTEGGVLRTLHELSQLADGLSAAVETVDGDAWFRWNDVFAPAGLSLRVSVPPSTIADAMEVLDRRFAGAAATLSATLSAGVVRANLRLSGDQRASVPVAHARDVAARFGGYAIVEAAPISYKREHDVFGPQRPDFAIMKRLKDEFDPRRTLSPGRFAGRL